MSKFFGVALAVLGGLVIANVVSSVREERANRVRMFADAYYQTDLQEKLFGAANADNAAANARGNLVEEATGVYDIGRGKLVSIQLKFANGKLADLATFINEKSWINSLQDKNKLVNYIVEKSGGKLKEDFIKKVLDITEKKQGADK